MAVVLSRVTATPQLGAYGEQLVLTARALDGVTPQAGLTINWAVTTGDSTLSAATSATGVDGQASITLTLGTDAANTVTATYAVTASTVSWAVNADINYNCACDDAFPSKTLLEMRTDCAVMLGMGEQVANLMPGVTREIDTMLRMAQEIVFKDLKLNRMQRYFTWQLEPGVRFYDFDANLYLCQKKIEPDEVKWVGISQDNNFWRPLVCGIVPMMYYGDIQGWPQYYAFRQCIEVWPPPSDNTWKLRILGTFGLMPLVEDTDKSTMDWQAIELYALARLKANRGQPDAANYAADYRSYIGKVVAGQHGLTRYVPGAYETAPPPLPIWTGQVGP